MRRIAAIVMSVALVFAAHPALAWWDFAKWGLTVDQIRAASGGRALKCDGPPCPRLYSGWSPNLYMPDVLAGGGHAFVAFYFDDAGRLSMTTLRFKDFPFPVMVDQLISVYGKPANFEGGAWPSYTWRDAAKGTVVKAEDLGSSNTQIVYMPVAKGL